MAVPLISPSPCTGVRIAGEELRPALYRQVKRRPRGQLVEVHVAAPARWRSRAHQEDVARRSDCHDAHERRQRHLDVGRKQRTLRARSSLMTSASAPTEGRRARRCAAPNCSHHRAPAGRTCGCAPPACRQARCPRRRSARSAHGRSIPSPRRPWRRRPWRPAALGPARMPALPKNVAGCPSSISPLSIFTCCPDLIVRAGGRSAEK